MKIEYITNSFAYTGGGLVGAVSGLAQAVRRKRYDVAVAAYDSFEDVDCWEGLDLRMIQAKQFAGVHFYGDLPMILTQQSPDLVHTHGLWLRSSAQSHCWCKSSRTPYVISPHGMLDSWAVKNSSWKKKLAGLWFEYAHLNGAACLHALCDSEADSIRQFGQKNPVCVIPNGIELPIIEGSQAQPPWLSSERKALLFMGRLHPKKGIPLLLEAWASLKKRNPSVSDEWFLAVAGWSEMGHREELELKVNSLGISEDVEFLGGLHKDSKEAALSNASGFVLPSYSEGLPMSILEAWSYRLPVLMTDECHLPDGFSAGAAIRLETNVSSIEEGLSDFFEMNPIDQLAMGNQGFQLVEQQFTWDQVATKMLGVYDWLLGGGDAPESVRVYE